MLGITEACVNCGHEGFMPFYRGYKEKRVKCFTTDLVCPKCRKVMCTDLNDFTPEEREERQVGKPSLCCGIHYEQAYEYGHKHVCKKCGKDFNRKETTHV